MAEDERRKGERQGPIMGEELKGFLRRTKLTREMLAEALWYSKDHLYRVERGERSIPHFARPFLAQLGK
jgi:hypothetical protein